MASRANTSPAPGSWPPAGANVVSLGGGRVLHASMAGGGRLPQNELMDESCSDLQGDRARDNLPRKRRAHDLCKNDTAGAQDAPACKRAIPYAVDSRAEPRAAPLEGAAPDAERPDGAEIEDSDLESVVGADDGSARGHLDTDAGTGSSAARGAEQQEHVSAVPRSAFDGVLFHGRCARRPWIGKLTAERTAFATLPFATQEEAARAYDDLVRERGLVGKRKLNFPRLEELERNERLRSPFRPGAWQGGVSPAELLTVAYPCDQPAAGSAREHGQRPGMDACASHDLGAPPSAALVVTPTAPAAQPCVPPLVLPPEVAVLGQAAAPQPPTVTQGTGPAAPLGSRDNAAHPGSFEAAAPASAAAASPPWPAAPSAAGCEREAQLSGAPTVQPAKMEQAEGRPAGMGQASRDMPCAGNRRFIGVQSKGGGTQPFFAVFEHEGNVRRERGCFATMEEAGRAYDDLVRELGLVDTRELNFPRPEELELQCFAMTEEAWRVYNDLARELGLVGTRKLQPGVAHVRVSGVSELVKPSAAVHHAGVLPVVTVAEIDLLDDDADSS